MALLNSLPEMIHCNLLVLIVLYIKGCLSPCFSCGCLSIAYALGAASSLQGVRQLCRNALSIFCLLFPRMKERKKTNAIDMIMEKYHYIC